MEHLYIPPGHLTAEQARQGLNISAGALRNLVYRGKLTRSGGTERHPLYAATDIAAILAERTHKTTPAKSA
ncbi:MULTISPECIES: hypothetical protein [unclassified Streptomyces]|uniref:hypothetical protein n=1 Tax=unclassified Streptomyces TaxID=2593676 RepID=UPI0036DFA622